VLFRSHDYLVTLEDASIVGGVGSAVLEFLNQQRISIPVLRLGLGDMFPSQGSREQVLEDYGIDEVTLRDAIVEFTQA
jgi:1-deoxy-D-xylulose-5-phosphate synthase